MNKNAILEKWNGRQDNHDGEFGYRWHQCIQAFEGQEDGICILGFCSDEGVRRNQGRLGAKDAPNVVRSAMANFPKVAVPIYDAGNICVVNSDLELARQDQIKQLSRIFKSGSFPLVLGGGHETALGNYLALAKEYNSIGIINVDAHFDLREPIKGLSSSGTPFYEAFEHANENQIDLGYFCLGIQDFANTEVLFRRARQYGVEWLSPELLTNNVSYVEKLVRFARKYDAVYLTIDLDAIDGAYAPGVSAVNPMGITPIKVIEILRAVWNTKKVKIMDVVEYNPVFDQDNRTAKVAAQFVWEVTTLKSKK